MNYKWDTYNDTIPKTEKIVQFPFKEFEISDYQKLVYDKRQACGRSYLQ